MAVDIIRVGQVADSKLAVKKELLLGDKTLTSTEEVYLYLDPGDDDRDIILPASVPVGRYYIITNVDGDKKLNIKETSSGPVILELSNTTNYLRAELVRSLDDWEVFVIAGS